MRFTQYITHNYWIYLVVLDIYLKYGLLLFEVKYINTENKRFIRYDILCNKQSIQCAIGIGNTTLLYCGFL